MLDATRKSDAPTKQLPNSHLLLIKNGETETTEFKATVGDATDFAETVVAFANQKGGNNSGRR